MKTRRSARKFARSVILLFLFLFLTLISARADEVDEYITTEMRKKQIPGLSLAIVKNKKILKSKGYGFANLELNVAATPNQGQTASGFDEI